MTDSRITQTDMRAAFMQVHTFFNAPGTFNRSLKAEFDGARDYIDHCADAADDLHKVLARQGDKPDRNIRADAIRLVALAEGVNALAYLQCNGVMRREADGRSFASWNDEDDRAQESTRTTLVQTMDAILDAYGARVASSYGDPRGHVVHLQFTDNSSNRGGRETVWGL